MRILDEMMMRELVFPDFDVEKMEYCSSEKTLKIFVEGAFLDIEDELPLGKGVLYFSDWENLSIRSYNHYTKEWSNITEFPVEPLKDLCEVEFTDSFTRLCGFGKEHGWMEWMIHKAKMHAEFES